MSTQSRNRCWALPLIATVALGLTACDGKDNSEQSRTTSHDDPSEQDINDDDDASDREGTGDEADGGERASNGDEPADPDEGTDQASSADEAGPEESMVEATDDDVEAEDLAPPMTPAADEGPSTADGDDGQPSDDAVDDGLDEGMLMDDDTDDTAVADDEVNDEPASGEMTDEEDPPMDEPAADGRPLAASHTPPEVQVDSMGDPLENPSSCPAEEPTAGEPCNSGTCKYGSDPNCRSRWLCSGGTWFFDFAKRGCEDACPAFEPNEGDPCTEQSAQCAYGEDPACRSLWMCYDESWYLIKPILDCQQNTCPEQPPEAGLACDQQQVGTGCLYAAGERCSCRCSWPPDAASDTPPEIKWACGVTAAVYPPDYLTNCPFELPEEGTPCDTTTTCGYSTGDTCEAPWSGITRAECVVGVWVHDSSQ